MTIFQRATLSLRHTPKRSLIVFLFYVVFIGTLFFLTSILNQLNLSLDAINDILDNNTNYTTTRNDFFHSIVISINEKITPTINYIYLLLIVGATFFVGLFAILFFLRKKEFASFQLMGERKRKIYFQLIFENLLLVNSFLLLLFLTSIFFRQPIANQLGELEQELVNQKTQQIIIKSDPLTDQKQVTSSNKDDEKVNRSTEESIYESGVSHFNSVVAVEKNTTAAIEPQDFTLFALLVNGFIALCLSPAAFWFIHRSSPSHVHQFS